MPDQESQFDRVHNRFDLLEAKIDALTHRLETLLGKLERGENWPLRNMPEPGNLNEVPHMPGLG
jgi:hypothetical protein